MPYSHIDDIVIIEDNLGDFILFEDFLIEKFSKTNIRHFTNFTNAANFLKDSDSDSVSVVLLDLHLPDLSGMDLVNSVLLLCKNIPVIILTGYVDIGLARNCLSIGAADYLIKDETTSELFQKAILYSLDRHSFNKRIEKEKQNYEMLFNFSPQPMFLYDHETQRIIEVNNAAILSYGYDKTEFVGLSIEKIVESEKPFYFIKEEGESTYVKKDFFSERATHRLKNGQLIQVETYKNQVEYNGQIATLMVCNNITEKLQYVETIQTQNIKLKNIAWTQSHILRAPLARMLGVLNLLETNTISDNELPFWLNQINITAKELDTIISNIVNETESLR